MGVVCDKLKFCPTAALNCCILAKTKADIANWSTYCYSSHWLRLVQQYSKPRLTARVWSHCNF